MFSKRLFQTLTLAIVICSTWMLLPVWAQTVISNNAADMLSHIVMVADSSTPRTVTNTFTFTGLQTFSRNPSAPFAVTASSAKVTNLDADKLDGLDGPTSAIVGINDTQTLTAKTLTSPTINTSMLGNVMYGLCGGRLTLTSGTPVTTADVTGATNIYWEPYSSTGTGTGVCGLYDGSATWTLLPFTATTLPVGTLTNDLPYDVFIYNNSGTLAIESLAWSSKTARATNLTTQNGVLVKTGATTRRFVGTFHTSATTTTEDSVTKRYLWNYYNRVRRPFLKRDATSSWTYTIATVRQARADTTNQVDLVVGWAEVPISLTLNVTVQPTVSNNCVIGFGEDSTSSYDARNVGGASSNTGYNQISASFNIYPAVGKHFYAWLEYSTAAGTTTWFGTGGFAVANQASGISGFIEG